jgi:hypothetical protein
MAEARNCVVTMCHWKRPEYTRRSLEALSRCVGIEQCLLMPRVEPGCPEVEALVRAVDFCECRPAWNPARLGVNRNTYAALEGGFALADFVVHVEDDVLLAPDALDYFWHARAAYHHDHEVFSVAAYHRVAAPLHLFSFHALGRRRWFHPWGWGTWRNRWDEVRGGLGRALGGPVTWDTWLGRNVVAPDEGPGRREVYPVLSRAQNIGLVSSIHATTPAWHAEHHQLKYWAGDVPVHPSPFHEEAA